MGCLHAAAKATEAAAAEAAEAATAAPRRIAGTPTHSYEPTREAAMAAFAKRLAAGTLVSLAIASHACGVVRNVCCDVSAPATAGLRLSAAPLPPARPAIACTS
jgi:hypothetical protein